MNSTPASKSWIKAFAIVLAALLFCGCMSKQTTQETDSEQQKTEDTLSGELEGLVFAQTDEATDTVKLEMTDGAIILMELYPEAAPETVKNFKKLVAQKFYDGLLFHRVVKNFVIQTGDPTATGTGGSDETIYGEFGINGFSNSVLHTRGTLSMARLQNDYNSASSQFFICHQDTPDLNGSYAAFGRVIAGMDTVDRIASVKTDAKSAPLSPQKIASIRFVTITKET